MKSQYIIIFTLIASIAATAQPKKISQEKKRLPIIDMHLHALNANAQGPPPVGLCLPVTDLPVTDPAKPYGPQFVNWLNNKNCSRKILSPLTDSALMQKTIQIIRKNNIYGVISGPLTENWVREMPDRLIPGLMFNLSPQTPGADSIKSLFKKGFYKLFSEVTIQYQGYEANDSLFEPYLAVMEQLDVPVGIHIGTGPPGAPYLGAIKYRARMHSPLAVEDVLIKHPRLRIYIMHAGWPMIDDLLAVLWTHPQVYLDVGVISFVLPRKEFHRYLQRIVESGFGKRVMFGSDQMVWPEAIEYAIESVETASFLSGEQKRDILFNNAAHFLRLTADEINKMHN